MNAPAALCLHRHRQFARSRRGIQCHPRPVLELALLLGYFAPRERAPSHSRTIHFRAGSRFKAAQVLMGDERLYWARRLFLVGTARASQIPCRFRSHFSPIHEGRSTRMARPLAIFLLQFGHGAGLLAESCPCWQEPISSRHFPLVASLPRAHSRY